MKNIWLTAFIVISSIFLCSSTITNAMMKKIDFSEENKRPSDNDNHEEGKHYPKSPSDFIIKYENNGKINECYEGAQLVFGNWMGHVNGYKLWLKIEPTIDSSNSVHIDAIWMNDSDGKKGMVRKRSYIYSFTFKNTKDLSFSIQGMEDCSGKLEKKTNIITGSHISLIRRNYLQYMEPNDPEYIEVKQLFDQTSHSPSTYAAPALGYKLVSVFRILHSSCFQSEEKPGKLLFHGADKQACNLICYSGFQVCVTNRTPNLIFGNVLYLTSDAWLAASVSRQVWDGFKNGNPSDTIIVTRCQLHSIGEVSHEEKQNKSWEWGEHDALHYIWPPQTGHDEYLLRDRSIANPVFLVWFE